MGFLKGSGADVKKNYKVGRQLGEGNFAVVKIAEKTSANKSAEIPQSLGAGHLHLDAGYSSCIELHHASRCKPGPWHRHLDARQ